MKLCLLGHLIPYPKSKLQTGGPIRDIGTERTSAFQTPKRMLKESCASFGIVGVGARHSSAASLSETGAPSFHSECLGHSLQSGPPWTPYHLTTRGKSFRVERTGASH